MPADALKCKECQTTYPLEARYVCDRCFGPLEVAYAPPTLDAGGAQAPHPGGPALALALRGLPARWRARPARRCPPAGRRWCKADRLAARLGLARGLGQERDRQPDALLQGPRRLRRARSCPGARLRDDRLCLDGQPRQRRRRARRGRRAARLRADPGRPRGGEDPRHRRLRRERGRGQGQLRRRQPALHRARRASAPTGRSSTSTCGPTTPRAPRRSASRSPSSSAGSCPTASSRRSPPARCSRRSRAAFEEWIDCGLLEGELPTMNGAQADGCSPVAQAFAAGTSVCRPVKPDTIAKSLAIGNPADGPYARRARPEDGRRRRLGHRRRDPRRHPPAGRDDRHLHRDRRRRDHRDARQARRARRHRPRPSASCSASPATG